MVIHSGAKGVMVWGCFSGFGGVGPIHQINAITDRFVYYDILEEKMVPHADNNASSMDISTRQQAITHIKTH